MVLNGNELGRRTAGGVQLRAEPMRMIVRLLDLPAADVHRIDLMLWCSVKALDRRGEREMFAETFLSGQESAGIQDIAHHFAGPLKSAAARVLATQPAEFWMNVQNQGPIVEAMRQAGERAAFACGVELLPPFELELGSATLERQKIEAAGYKLSEFRTVAQMEQVQRASGLLQQFESLRKTMPELSASEVLERFGGADAGAMMQSLLLASGRSSSAVLWVVAGTSLLRVRPRPLPVTTTLLELPGDLGPLRSVQADGQRLLVGAQGGVMIVDPDRPGQARMLREPQVRSALGFNSAAASGDLIWASHGESGVVAWDASRPDETARAIRTATGARNLVALNDASVLYSIGGDVLRATIDADAAVVATGRAPVMMILPERDRVVLVRSDGTIEHLDRCNFARSKVQRRCGEISSAGVLPWRGSSRLLLATVDGPVYCVGLDDSVVTQYLSPPKGLRAIAACADVIAALAADRQRIVLWQTWAGDAVQADIHVSSVARHRAADVCFA